MDVSSKDSLEIKTSSPTQVTGCYNVISNDHFINKDSFNSKDSFNNKGNLAPTPNSLFDSGVFGSEFDKGSTPSNCDTDSLNSFCNDSSSHNSPPQCQHLTGTTWKDIATNKNGCSLSTNYYMIPELACDVLLNKDKIEEDNCSEISCIEDVQDTIHNDLNVSYHWDEYIPSTWSEENGLDAMNMSLDGTIFHDLFNYAIEPGCVVEPNALKTNEMSSQTIEDLNIIESEKILLINSSIDSPNDSSTDNSSKVIVSPPHLTLKYILSQLDNYLQQYSDTKELDDTSFLAHSNNLITKKQKCNTKEVSKENVYLPLLNFLKLTFPSQKMKVLLNVVKKEENKQSLSKDRSQILENLTLKVYQYQKMINGNLYKDNKDWGLKEICKVGELAEILQFKIIMNSIVNAKKLRMNKDCIGNDKISQIMEEFYENIFVKNIKSTFLNLDLCKIILGDLERKIGRGRINNDGIKKEFLLLKHLADLHFLEHPQPTNKDSYSEAIIFEDLNLIRTFLNKGFKLLRMDDYYPLSNSHKLVLINQKNKSLYIYLFGIIFGISLVLATFAFHIFSDTNCCSKNGLVLNRKGNGDPAM
uniref:NR LBD domain-containing protein n=1 Tax=Rhabditophanes sp. KR3021 TaxID=114890 RepID=A0AC35UHJ3_9BILA